MLAESKFQAAYRIDPSDFDVLANYGRFLVLKIQKYEEGDDYEKAEIMFRQALVSREYDVDTLVSYALLLLNRRATMERVDKAKKMLQDAMKIEENNVMAHYLYGELLILRERRPKEALEHLTKAKKFSIQPSTKRKLEELSLQAKALLQQADPLPIQHENGSVIWQGDSSSQAVQARSDSTNA